MDRQAQIRPIGPDGLEEALDLTRAVFMDFVAPEFSAVLARS